MTLQANLSQLLSPNDEGLFPPLEGARTPSNKKKDRRRRIVQLARAHARVALYYIKQDMHGALHETNLMAMPTTIGIRGCI